MRNLFCALAHLAKCAALAGPCLAFALIQNLDAAEPEWKAGTARIRITPDLPLPMAGYASRTNPFERVEQEILEKTVGPLQLWVAAYCNDVFGYLPSARVLQEGGYECRGLYTTQGFFAPTAQEVLAAKVGELARKAGRK